MNRKQSLIDVNKEKEEAIKICNEFKNILQLGLIYFKDSQTQEGKPLIRVKHNVSIEECVQQVFHKLWKLRHPRIVVLIISNVGPLKQWTNNKQLKRFQRGIIKAADNTNMWLLTNGIEMGTTSLIGEAVRNEITDAKHSKDKTEKHKSNLTIIGIADEDMLRYGASIALSKEYKIDVPNDGTAHDSKYELNADLSHYIVVKDDTINKNGINVFLTNFVSFLSSVNEPKGLDDSRNAISDLCSLVDYEIPVVSIVIQGGYDSSRLVLQQIKNRIPVVVFRGSGGLADLLAFVEYEIRERCLDVWDSEFVESYVKPQLTIKIVQRFPKLIHNALLCKTFRDRILDCVRESRKEGQIYLTVINIFNSYECDLENLTEYLLKALFKSQQTHQKTSDSGAKDGESKPNEEIIKKHLNLCVDWNCPEVAKREVLAKDPSFALHLEKKLFEESLTRTNRIEFVDLFLSHKFKLRAFVNSKRIRRMYRIIHSHDFFRTVCWEGILGRTVFMKQSTKFLERELNWMIEACTGLRGFIEEEELDSFNSGLFVDSEKQAERKSLAILVIWALFDFRKRLVRVLWKHSDQPIHLAIIIATFYERLSWYVSEQGLNNELKQESNHFVVYAYNILDSVYKDSSDRAEEVLNESSKDWNYKSPVDLAAFAKFRLFLSHPCCQKWLTNTFNGNISLRELRFGFMRLPALVKILLSAFLLFPMYFWIRFKDTTNREIQVEEEIIDEEEDNYNKKRRMKRSDLNHKLELNQIQSNIKSSESQDQNNSKSKPRALLSKVPIVPNITKFSGATIADREILIRNQPPPWVMVYELWNAPITKFWVFQLFYIFYLSLFSVAVLFPRCGNYYLDLFVCIWTILLVADLIRQTYLFRLKYSNLPISFKILEIAFQTAVLTVYISGRLLSHQIFPYVTPYREKVILCIALLHAYYVLIVIFLPISATLGPLLYRLKIMILVDFLNFIRLSVLVMVSFGVVIQTVLYPDSPLTNELFRKTFHRAFFTLFSTPTDDLIADTTCGPYLRNGSSNDGLCYSSLYTNESCRNTGFWPYTFSISYFVMLKLILTTLLYAIFASSASSLTADTDSIWKFQRYILVMDFVERLPFPPPLNIFCYIFYGIRWIYRLICCYKSNKNENTNFGKMIAPNSKPENKTKLLADEDYTYLRTIASEYYDLQENKVSNESLQRLQWERIQANSEEMEYEKKVLRQLKGKMSETERAVRQSLVYLESIKHLTSKKYGIESGHKKNKGHIISRHSPYPNTDVQRFPVPDKYVSWDVLWINYDPIAYTKPKYEFPKNLQEFADEDLLLLQEQQIDEQNQKLPVLEWNRSSTNAAGITIDRQSWELSENETLIIYKLDNGIPINYMGRTGLRGRGSLLRWGPNHYVMIVITRMQSNNFLEVVVEINRTNPSAQSISLLSRFIPGECTYTELESLFITEANKKWTDSDKMIEFFKSCDISDDIPQETKTETTVSESGLKFERIMRGYFDESLNTDQAWKEVELWHFHYTHNCSLKDKMKENIEWRDVNENLFVKLIPSQSTVMQDIVDKFGANIHN